MSEKHYKAFISYSHQDEKFGSWLHKQLENYKIPKQLKEDYPHLPKKLFPIFRDIYELSAGDDLKVEIDKALRNSDALILLCSPKSAKSEWVNKEIIDFKKLHKDAKIIPIIIEGVPFAKENDKLDDELECFPEALKYELDSDGNLTNKEVEIVASNAINKSEGRDLAKLKLISGLLDVPFSDLYRRDKEQEKRTRRIQWSIGSFVFFVMLGLTIFSWVQMEWAKKSAKMAAEVLMYETTKVKKIKNKYNLKNLDKFYYLNGKKYMFQHQYAQAIKAFKQSIEINPNKDIIYYALGDAYLSNDKYDKAIESYKKGMEINPRKQYEVYHNIGNIYHEKKEQYAKAIKVYEKAIEINPKRDDAYYGIGNTYISQKKYNKAIEAYQKYIKINPKNYKVYNNMGIAYYKKRNYDKAIIYYKKAISINPKIYETYLAMGFTYDKKEEYNKAIESYIKALTINPNDNSVYLTLFELQLIQNQLFNKVLELKFIKLFQNKKEIFIEYEMLKLFQNIVNEKEVNLEYWKQKYLGVNLNCNFYKLYMWIYELKNQKIMDKLLKAIEFFENKSKKSKNLMS